MEYLYQKVHARLKSYLNDCHVKLMTITLNIIDLFIKSLNLFAPVIIFNLPVFISCISSVI